VALPGLFERYPLGDRLLIDGGMVNPVPFDLLECQCDITVAVDVMGTRTRHERPGGLPFFETVFTTFQIMQQAILGDYRLSSRNVTRTISVSSGTLVLLKPRTSQSFSMVRFSCSTSPYIWRMPRERA